MSGYLRAQRARFDHPLFRSEKFCRGYAWDWLVANAAYRDRQIDVAGRIVHLRRGQLCHSIRHLAAVWNWDKAAVSRFIARLQTESMIETSTETGQTIITICNYSKYQDDDKKTETPTETPTETAARQQRDSSETIKKEGKEGKERKESNLVVVSARERETTWNPSTLWRAAAEAAGLNPDDRLPTYWMPPSAHVECWAWVNDTGLSPEQIIHAIRENRQARRDTPDGPRGLTKMLHRYAAALIRPAAQSRASPPPGKTNRELGEIAMAKLEEQNRLRAIR